MPGTLPSDLSLFTSPEVLVFLKLASIVSVSYTHLRAHET